MVGHDFHLTKAQARMRKIMVDHDFPFSFHFLRETIPTHAGEVRGDGLL
jgi:hypothetical protein